MTFELFTFDISVLPPRFFSPSSLPPGSRCLQRGRAGGRGSREGNYVLPKNGNAAETNGLPSASSGPHRRQRGDNVITQRIAFQFFRPEIEKRAMYARHHVRVVAPSILLRDALLRYTVCIACACCFTIQSGEIRRARASRRIICYI